MEKEDWDEVFSQKHQATYYYNKNTNQSVWKRPECMIDNNSSNENSIASSSSSQKIASDNIEEQNVHKKRRANDEKNVVSNVKTVLTTSYQPPISGAAVDYLKMKSENLPEPKIISDLKLPFSKEDIWTRKDIQVNDYLASVYRNGYIEDSKGHHQKFKDSTNPLQGKHLYNLVKENKFTRTIEIGFAMGASACWITQAHKELNNNGLHIAIDPNQTAQYENMGRTLVERAGNIDYLRVMEMTSYRALPKLLEDILQGNIGKFHLIYIDGWHTFDYTLVDFFFSDLILEVNGIIVLDDIKHAPVKKCLHYIETNYPNYKVVDETPCFNRGDPKATSQATFIKKALDTRVWNHHVEF